MAGAERLTATGALVEHWLQCRRGSMDGTYGDIYTISCVFKLGTTDRVRLKIQADSYAYAGWVEANLTTGLVTGTGIIAAGIIVASGIVDVGGGWYRLYITVDMSAIASAVGRSAATSTS